MNTAVGARLPGFGKPRLEIEGLAVDPNESRLSEQAYEVGALIAGDEAVERAWLGAD